MTALTAPQTVPCGIHTSLPQGQVVACGGTCHIVIVDCELVHYRCDICGFRQARYRDGRPLPAWDGLLRDGSSYADSAVDEHHWSL